MMGLTVRVGVAPQRSHVSLLCGLPGDSDHASDGRIRMMAQLERDDLLLAAGNCLFGARRAGVTARVFKAHLSHALCVAWSRS